MAAALINVNVGMYELLPVRADHLHLPLTGRHLLTAGAGVHQGVFLFYSHRRRSTGSPAGCDLHGHSRSAVFHL
ncbi:hypothetical protein J4Q44_G00110010 [Coregonus suidteri]|uniref:Uncharacterized protein n=1 Tax=Coregonus suidteri TaxID=861788 RepID=A0AAN8M3E3_9TELE